MRIGLLLAGGLASAVMGTAHAQSIPNWRLSEIETLSLEEDGTPEREFARIVGAFLVGNDHIAVADNASGEVRFFGSDGRWTRSVGRQGSGPGEFLFLRHAFRSGDTLFTFDPMLKRVTAIAGGEVPTVANGITINARGGRSFEIRGRSADGRWVAQYTEDEGWDASPGVNRARGGVGMVSASGDGNVRWLAALRDAASFVHNPTGNIRQASSGPIAFTPRIYSAGSGPVIWFGESSTAEIIRHDSRSGTRRTIRLPLEARVPTREMISASRAEDDANDPRGSQSFRNAKFSAEYLPRNLPYFEALVPTGDGGVWIQEYAGVRSQAARYLVLDAEGRPVAWVSVPPSFRVTDVRGTRVAGLYRDADGLDEVRVYALIQR